MHQCDITAAGAIGCHRFRPRPQKGMEQLDRVNAVEEGMAGARIGEVTNGGAGRHGQREGAKARQARLQFQHLHGIAHRRTGQERHAGFAGELTQR